MPQNKKQIIEERRHRVAAFYLKGLAQYKIAEIVGVTQGQIANDLKALTKRWRESGMIDFNEAKAKELAKIENLEQEYWTAWEKSKEDYLEKTSKAKGTKEKVSSVEKTTKEVIVYGDPAFLRGVQWCIDKRCDILGIRAPQQIESKIVNEFETMTDEELEKLVND